MRCMKLLILVAGCAVVAAKAHAELTATQMSVALNVCTQQSAVMATAAQTYTINEVMRLMLENEALRKQLAELTKPNEQPNK